jgi:hypothetical protein
MALKPKSGTAKASPNTLKHLHFSSFHVARCPMPDDYITNQFPVRLSTIEEYSIPGNLSVHEDVFVTQLKLTYSELRKKSDFVY